MNVSTEILGPERHKHETAIVAIVHKMAQIGTYLKYELEKTRLSWKVVQSMSENFYLSVVR